MRIICLVLTICSLILLVSSQNIVTAQVFTDKEINDTNFELSYKPIKFTDQKGDILLGYFPGSNTFNAIIEFKFLPNDRGEFIKTGNREGSDIGKKEFLKKFKKDIWIVVYHKEGNDNFIYQAVQAGSLKGLAPGYAQDDNDRYQTVENVEFWEAMRSKIAIIKGFDDKTGVIEWEFIQSITKDEFSAISSTKGKYSDLVKELTAPKDANPTFGEIAKQMSIEPDALLKLLKIQLIRFSDGGFGKVAETGTLKMTPYTRVSGMIKKAEKTYEIGLDQKFVKANSEKYFWMIYYNPDSKVILRIVVRLPNE